MKYSDIILICVITILPIYIFATSKKGKVSRNKKTNHQPIIVFFDYPKKPKYTTNTPQIPQPIDLNNKGLLDSNPDIIINDLEDKKIHPLHGDISSIDNMIAKPWDTHSMNYINIQDDAYNDQLNIMNNNKNKVTLDNIIQKKSPVSYGLFDIDNNMYYSLNYNNESSMVNYKEDLNESRVSSFNNLTNCS